MAQGKDFCLECNSCTERITKHGEQRNQGLASSSRSLSRSCAKCNRFTDDRVSGKHRICREHTEICKPILWQFCGNSLHKLPQIGPNRTFRETRPASLLTRGNGIEFNYLEGQ